MNHDPEVYGDPENFRPERFLDEAGQNEVIPPFTHGEVSIGFAYLRILNSCRSSCRATRSSVMDDVGAPVLLSQTQLSC